MELLDWIAANFAFIVLMCSLACLVAFSVLRRPARAAASFLAMAWSLWEVTH
ncbi:MAG: hypothetical protein LKJ94_05820 [Candidatus Methanomethylophilus sp.]|jgi:hypothetical protein|nr:hypothetical protein [Methanomethylophilus sp.]MCI2092540.1 hypothetical protein [Methanomethylophilus sp.]